MSTYRKGARGLEITRLEISLGEMGLYRGPLDDVFGEGMEAAVRAYQERAGLPVTGVVNERVRALILDEPSPRAAAVRGRATDFRSLALTAGFETSAGAPECFAGLAGDFDGQGLSFGVLQWNLGQGTLQPLLRQLDADHPDVVRAAFGTAYWELREVLTESRPVQLAWARALQTANRRSLVEPWRSRFRALGLTPECQAAQVWAARERYEQARRLCRDYGLWSERGVALMFDIVVQNGSIRAATRQVILDEYQTIPASATREEREVARMRIVANRRAEASRREYVNDVRRRKLAIADGVGIVHGVGYDVGRQFLLGLVPVADEEPSTLIPTPV